MTSSRIRPDVTGAEEQAPLAESETRVILSRKELARHYRQQAYQKAKAWRAQDPKHLALKEAAKVRRRELYQQVKARRKAADSQEKVKQATEQAEERQATKKKELRSDRQGELRNRQRELQSELQSALKNKRVIELMQRVRLASEDASIIANSILADSIVADPPLPDTVTSEAHSSSGAVPSSRSRRATRAPPD